MGGLFSGTTIKNTQTPAAGLAMQSSSYGWPIPLIYGRNRVTANLIGYYDFKAIPHVTKSSSGGKGGGTTTKTTTYTYSATFMHAIGEGQCTSLNANWADKSFDNTASKFSFFSGSYSQTAWSYMSSNHVSDALNYRGIAYTAAANYDLGDSASMPVFSFDVAGLLPYGGSVTDTSMQILLHFNDSVGTPTPVDDSGILWSASGDSSASSAHSKFLSNCWEMSTIGGSPGSLAASITGMNAGTGAFGVSLEFWPTAYGTYGTIWCVDRYGYGVGAMSLSYDSAGSTVNFWVYSYSSTAPVFSMSVSEIPTGQWNHIEINRDNSGNLWMTVGGAVKASLSGFNTAINFGATGNFTIGYSSIFGRGAAGYYCEFGLKVGNYFHAGAFTPPASIYAFRPTVSASDGSNPAAIVPDLITNQHYGVGLSSGYISSLSTYSDYCVANNLFLSPVYDKQSETRQMLADIFMLTNSGCFFSEKVLKVAPFGDATVTANGVTYTPSMSASYNLSDDDFLDQDNPVKVNRKKSSDFYNYVEVEYLDKNNQFNKCVGKAFDQSSIDAYGLRKMDMVEAHCITDGATASKVAQLLMLRALYVKAQYEFKIGFRYCLLEPCDYVTITDTGLGISSMLVRILSIEESDDGELSVVAEDAQLGSGHSANYAYSSAAGYVSNTSVDPGSVVPPVIFEDPNQSTASALRLGIAVTGNSANWGGCEVWASNDGSNYQYTGVVNGGARYGTIANNISSAVGEIPRVSLVGNGGKFVSGSSADADANSTLCLIGGEYVDYTSSALVSTNVYDLTLHNRGVYGTSSASHSSGASFVRCDGAIVYTEQLGLATIGKTIYLKFLSFNIYGGGMQDISAATAYTYTITGAMVPAAKAVVSGALGVNLKQDFYPVTQTISSASHVVTIDLSSTVQDYVLALTENVTSFSFTNLPPSGSVREITLETVQDAVTAYTCVNPGTKTAGSWTQSTTLGAKQTIRLRIFHDGTIHNFPDPVLV